MVTVPIEYLDKIQLRLHDAMITCSALQMAASATPDDAQIKKLLHDAYRTMDFYQDLVEALRVGTKGLIKFITTEGGLKSYADVVSVEWWTHEIDTWIGAEESQVIRDLLGGSE